MTKEEAIQMGGKLWVKEHLERVYFPKDIILKLLDGYTVTDFESRKISQSKTFFDCNNKMLRSDTGTVRVLLNRAGFDCKK